MAKLVFAALALFLAFIITCEAYTPGVNFTTLPKTLVVTAQINGQDIHPGSTMLYMHDNLTVTWRLNETFWGQDTNYKKVLMKLCFGAISAQNRKWRANNVDLNKSKTCKYVIAGQAYTPYGNKTVYRAPNNTPYAFYFVRAFVLNSTSSQATPGNSAVAFGQTTNQNRTTNLFTVTPYTGMTWSLNITMIVISVSSYVCLIGYFLIERSRKKDA